MKSEGKIWILIAYWLDVYFFSNYASLGHLFLIALKITLDITIDERRKVTETQIGVSSLVARK